MSASVFLLFTGLDECFGCGGSADMLGVFDSLEAAQAEAQRSHQIHPTSWQHSDDRAGPAATSGGLEFWIERHWPKSVEQVADAVHDDVEAARLVCVSQWIK